MQPFCLGSSPLRVGGTSDVPSDDLSEVEHAFCRLVLRASDGAGLAGCRIAPGRGFLGRPARRSVAGRASLGRPSAGRLAADPRWLGAAKLVDAKESGPPAGVAPDGGCSAGGLPHPGRVDCLFRAQGSTPNEAAVAAFGPIPGFLARVGGRIATISGDELTESASLALSRGEREESPCDLLFALCWPSWTGFSSRRTPRTSARRSRRARGPQISCTARVT